MALGLKLIRIALLYMLVGLVMGLVMAVSRDWTLMSVHSHVLLLGWVTMAISGIVYVTVPRCADRKLAALHFWGHNIGLPIMMISLALEQYGQVAAEPAIGLGSCVVLISLAALVLNVFSVRNPATA